MAFYVNLSTAFVLQGNLEEATRALSHVQSIAPAAPSVVLLSSYLHIVAKKVPIAREILKRHRAPDLSLGAAPAVQATPPPAQPHNDA